MSAFILATKAHEVDNNVIDKQSPLYDDMLYFLAFDMAILGGSLERYKIYAHKIRQVREMR